MLKTGLHKLKFYFQNLPTLTSTPVLGFIRHRIYKKPARVTPTRHSQTLTDKIVSNNPKRVTHIYVLPCANIGDYDGPCACLNICTERFVQQGKFIRSLRTQPLTTGMYARHRSHHLCSRKSRQYIETAQETCT